MCVLYVCMYVRVSVFVLVDARTASLPYPLLLATTLQHINPRNTKQNKHLNAGPALFVFLCISVCKTAVTLSSPLKDTMHRVVVYVSDV